MYRLYISGNPGREMVNVLDCDIELSEFGLIPRYYIHLHNNNLRKV